MTGQVWRCRFCGLEHEDEPYGIHQPLRLPKELKDAEENFEKVAKTYDQARQTFDRAQEAYDKGRRAYYQAVSAYCEPVKEGR